MEDKLYRDELKYCPPCFSSKDIIAHPVLFYFARHQIVQKMILIYISFAAVLWILPELYSM